ncbi:SpoIIE family protein phosphatase [Salinispira pacifica]|uniref:HAMP domain-containing protein n=1 Tax=Salinispira pacifica TaxID=1307761 RepID=V5WHI5_9SPIO|nr:SpoIIE family protein phosphatase [Salinispira pacifica]AHC15297.1 hypothetical protein L21SP2_1926 [Salinispira pacifica]
MRRKQNRFTSTDNGHPQSCISPRRAQLPLLVLFLLAVSSPAALFSQEVGNTRIYLEPPRQLLQDDVRVPELVSFDDRLYVFFQRVIGGEQGSLSVAYITSEDGMEWSDERVLRENIPLESDSIPPVYSVAVGEGEIAVAVTVSENDVELYHARRGRPLILEEEIISSNPVVNPVLRPRDDGFILFLSRRSQRLSQDAVIAAEVFNIVYSLRTSGRGWSDIRTLNTPENQRQIFNPAFLDTGDREYLVYEARNISAEFGAYNQLYSMVSRDNGESWSEPVNITDFVDFEDSTNSSIVYQNYTNQNPRLSLGEDGLPVLLYERNRLGLNARISISRLDRSGLVRVERNRRNVYISPENRASGAPRHILFRGEEYVLFYYDPLGQSRVYLARRDVPEWDTFELTSGFSGVFPRFAVHNGRLHILWLRRNLQEGGPGSLAYREPDQSVEPPIARPLNFQPAVPDNIQELAFDIQLPDDPAGIRSVSYLWTQDEDADPRDLQSVGLTENIILNANRHGTWNLFLSVRDGAGNSSDISRISYELDLVPPPKVEFPPLPLDDQGYLESNSISIPWLESQADDLAGYRLRLEYIADADAELENPEEVRQRVAENFSSRVSIFREENSLRLFNEDNGLWALAVRAVDRVGNSSEPAVALIRMNKYVPVTLLNLITLEENILGEKILEFQGRGYTANGRISRIVFDRNGSAPWDHELLLSDGDYRILSDRRISGISLRDVSSGEYQIGMFHEDRGWYFHSRNLALDATGAVKLGRYELTPPPEVSMTGEEVRRLSAMQISVILIIPLLILVIFISLFRMRSIIRDNRAIQQEVLALIEGSQSPSSRVLEEKVSTMQKQGMGLRAKFTIFMLILVIAVVAVVSLPLSTFILTNQQETLAQGLEDRIEVMIRSLSTGAAGVLDDSSALNIIRGLGDLTNQVSAMSEIEYVTITSRPNDLELDQDAREFIWATTDEYLFMSDTQREEYLNRISAEYQGDRYFSRDTEPRAENLIAGRLRIRDSVSEQIVDEVIPGFNESFEDPEIRQIVSDLRSLQEARSGASDEEFQQLLNQEEILLDRLSSELEQEAEILSEPSFSVQNYDLDSQYYTFFYPVYWIENDFSFQYQGTVRLGISTESINTRIQSTRRTILIQVGIFAAIAVAAGVAGALLLASITVNPIKQLVAGVERIRDTEKKSDLKGSPIVVKTRDELNFLSETINQMTAGLIKAEAANKSVMMGKDVQKMFITLDPNPHDAKTKATTRHEITDEVEFFGYYEGAKGVSGDYYYYQKIDDRKYAMIKCDVSGKDIEAALIMVTVATLFLQHFDSWQDKQLRERRIAHALKQKVQSGARLSQLATNINEIIYAREFKGKFAAFNMLTLDEKSGEITFCNAGDNIVHLYRRSQKKVVQIQLKQTPAAGAVSERVMGMPIEFPEETARLEKGDIMLLFTDGYEEARRYLRYEDWNVYKADDFAGEDGKKELEALEEEMKPFIMGQDEDGLGEAFSIPRIHDVVEAVMNRQMYRLTKFRNPAGDEDLLFDFSAMEPNLENLILALMSVEKVFRLVPIPGLTHEDRINVDKKIDEFLKKYFLQYSRYFNHPMETDENSLYQRFSHIKEDSQYDDLTILAVEKK